MDIVVDVGEQQSSPSVTDQILTRCSCAEQGISFRHQLPGEMTTEFGICVGGDAQVALGKILPLLWIVVQAFPNPVTGFSCDSRYRELDLRFHVKSEGVSPESSQECRAFDLSENGPSLEAIIQTAIDIQFRALPLDAAVDLSESTSLLTAEEHIIIPRIHTQPDDLDVGSLPLVDGPTRRQRNRVGSGVITVADAQMILGENPTEGGRNSDRNE